MTPERYRQMNEPGDLKFTEAELREGWHYCPDWDFLVMRAGHPDPGAFDSCSCKCWTEDEIKAFGATC